MERTYYNGQSEGLSEMIKDRVSEYLEDKGYLSWWKWVNNENDMEIFHDNIYLYWCDQNLNSFSYLLTTQLHLSFKQVGLSFKEAL